MLKKEKERKTLRKTLTNIKKDINKSSCSASKIV